MSTSGSSVRADRGRRHHYASECPTVLTVAEGVEYVFGIPGEETIRFVDALNGSGIRYVMVRHEQAASFMAEIYGQLTGRAGVCSAARGSGAILAGHGVRVAYSE
jgi:acetolactate synthase-1/2/3 large subunit